MVEDFAYDVGLRLDGLALDVDDTHRVRDREGEAEEDLGVHVCGQPARNSGVESRAARYCCWTRAKSSTWLQLLGGLRLARGSPEVVETARR